MLEIIDSTQKSCQAVLAAEGHLRKGQRDGGGPASQGREDADPTCCATGK